MTSSRLDISNGRILISGTGRAGTTLLVQVFTALGFDTGYSFEEAVGKVDSISKAGLEHSILNPSAPYVIKSPWFSDTLPEALEKYNVKVKYCIIPVRKLFDAAESRRRVYNASKAEGYDPLKQPGTLWKTENPREQEDRLAVQFFKLIDILVEYQITIHFLHFPRFAKDPDYFCGALKPVFDEHGVSMSEAREAFERAVRRDMIHDFSSKNN